MSIVERNSSRPSGFQLAVIARIAAAIGGGYAFTWGFTALGITVLVALGVDFHEAEMGMLMLAFILFLGLFLWAFSAGSLKWVWVMLVGGAGLMTGMAWLLQGVLI